MLNLQYKNCIYSHSFPLRFFKGREGNSSLDTVETKSDRQQNTRLFFMVRLAEKRIKD